MKLFVLLTSWVKFSTSVEVVDCTLPACSTDNCNVNTVECDRTCDGGVFGTDVECPQEQLKMTGSCGFAECDAVKTNTVADGHFVWCKPNGMTVVVLDSVFSDLNIDPTTTTVEGQIAPPCQKINFIIGDLKFMYYYLPLNTDCGTTAVTSDDNIVFENKVKGLPRTADGISRGSEFELNVMCTFESHETVQVGEISPEMLKITEDDSETGSFEVKMALYKTDQFEVLQPDAFTIVVDALLFGQVETVGTPDNIAAVLKRCWATPTTDAEADEGPDFIKDFLAVAGQKADIIALSPGSVAQFTLASFAWTTGSPTFDKIYLNCEVLICDIVIGEDTCVRPKAGRRRRSADTADEIIKTIQIGPISI